MGKVIDKWVKVIKMWDDIYDAYRHRYNPNRSVALRANMYMDSNFTYSGVDKVSAYYLIEEMPPEMELGYRKTLRSVVPLGISMNFIEDNESYEVKWGDASFKSRMAILDDVSRDMAEEREGASKYTQHKHQRATDREMRLTQSIDYVRTATMSSDNMRHLYKVRTLVIITGQRGLDFENCLKDFEKLCENRTGLKVRRLIGQITPALRAFSPLSSDMTKDMHKQYRSTFTSDELRARWHPYEQGIVGYGKVYLGTNIDTNSPVFKTFKKSPTDPEIVIVIGMTGSGKSYLMKVYSTQLIGDPNMVMTINDYEGGEYKMLGALVGENGKVVELDLSQGSGRYYDPVPLTPTGNDDIDITLLPMARDNIIALFRAVAGDKVLADYRWVSLIIEKGVDKFYNDNGVTTNTDTWHRTLGKSVYDVYQSMLEYRPDTGEDLKAFEEDYIYFIEKFSSYFDKSKKINNYFTHPISLEQIRDADLVICNYNMRGVSESRLSELDSILIPLNASIISFYRTIFPYAQGKYNVKIWEELQRFSRLRNATDLLQVPITGGRKMGDINIVGSNDPNSLVESDPYTLFGNYTLALVGKIPSEPIRRKVCERLDLMELKDELDAIGTIEEEDDGVDVDYDEVFMNPYKKAFVAKLGAESVVIKADIPKWLSKTPLFATGVRKEEGGTT